MILSFETKATVIHKNRYGQATVVICQVPCGKALAVDWMFFVAVESTVARTLCAWANRTLDSPYRKELCAQTWSERRTP